MIFSLFFILISNSFSIHSNTETLKVLDTKNLCQDINDKNLCIIDEIQENSHLIIDSSENDKTLFILLQDINDDHEIHISQLDIYGQVFLTSNRMLHITVDGDLNIKGNVAINNFFLSIFTLNLQNQSNFIIDTITANTINFTCDENFTCSSIRAQNFYSISNSVSIEFNEQISFDKIGQTSTILTILDGQPPDFNFTVLNSTFRIIVYDETNSINSQPQSRSDSQGSFNLVAKFLGCRVPYHINNQECKPCSPNQASLVDGSTTCSVCPAGTEYSTETLRCEPCQPGSYYNQNTRKCSLCPIGSYQSDSMKTECIKCPENSTTLQSGESSIYSCVCPAGFYGRSGERCQQCSETEECSFGSLYPLANPGHWIDENNFYYSNVCQPKYACFGNSTCEKGYEGLFCGTCSKGYFRLHQSCVKCNSAVPPIFAIIMVLLVGLMYYLAIYKNDYFPLFMIFINFFQEISMFSYLNSTFKLGSAKFFSYLSLLYFNPQIFQPQCYGLHSYSASIQVAIAIPLCIGLILFLCSILSWFIPCVYKFFTAEKKFKNKNRFKMFYYNYNIFECLRLFKESAIASFYVFFPAYFALIMRTVKYSQIKLGKVVEYLDLEPSSIYNDPVIVPSRISSIIILIILALFVISLDLKISIKRWKKLDDDDQKAEKQENIAYKVIIIGNIKSVVSFTKNCYKCIFKKEYWIIIFHLKIILICVAWIYLQRYLVFQYGLLLAIYTVYLSLQLSNSPWSDYNLIALLAEILKFLIILVVASQVKDDNSTDSLNGFVIFASVLFLGLFLVFTAFQIYHNTYKKSFKNDIQYDSIGQTTDSDFSALLGTGEQSSQLIEDFINNGSISVIKMLAIPDSKANDKMLDVYYQFVNYARDSKQDFRVFNNFVDLKLRPTVLKMVSCIILDLPTFYGVFLDRIAFLWSYLMKKKKNEKNHI